MASSDYTAQLPLVSTNPPDVWGRSILEAITELRAKGATQADIQAAIQQALSSSIAIDKARNDAQEAAATAKIYANEAKQHLDLITAPAEAVVADFVTKGATKAAIDGQRGRVILPTEDLPAVIAAASAGAVFALVPGATYTIEQRIRFGAARVTLDMRGAMIRLSDTAQRNSDPDRLVFFASTATECILRDGRCGRRPAAANVGGDSAVSIQIHGQRNRVERLVVDTGVPNSIAVREGNDHEVVANRVVGGAISYSWAGTSRIRCENNTIIDAPTNALSGTGNATAYNTDCIVRGNTIINCGRIGIEDYGKTLRTIISGNVIIGCSIMGISAIGVGAIIEHNSITDPGTQYGIETPANGFIISGNVVAWSSNAAAGTGIMVNQSNVDNGTYPQHLGSVITGNKVTNAAVGICLLGKLPSVEMVGNEIIDPRSVGIQGNVESSHSINVSGGSITFTTPRSASGFRAAVQSISASSVMNVTGLVAIFLAASAGPTDDFYVHAEAPISVTGCSFDGRGRSDAKKPILGRLYDFKTKNCLVTGNTFRGGATIRTDHFDAPTSIVTPNLITA